MKKQTSIDAIIPELNALRRKTVQLQKDFKWLHEKHVDVAALEKRIDKLEKLYLALAVALENSKSLLQEEIAACAAEICFPHTNKSEIAKIAQRGSHIPPAQQGDQESNSHIFGTEEERREALMKRNDRELESKDE